MNEKMAEIFTLLQYEIFIKELKMYPKVIRILSKGYLPISLLPPSKLERILSEVRIVLFKTKTMA